MLFIRLIDLVCFPMAAIRINMGSMSLSCGKRPFQVSLWCFDVTVQYFQGVLYKKRKALIKHIEGSNVLVECE